MRASPSGLGLAVSSAFVSPVNSERTNSIAGEPRFEWRATLALWLILAALGFAPLPLMADSALGLTEIDIGDGGHRRTFEVATNELYVRSATGDERVLRCPHSTNVIDLYQQAFYLEQSAGVKSSLVLYEKNRPRSESTRRVLTKKLLVLLKPGVEPRTIAQEFGVQTARSVDYAPDYFIFEAHEIGSVLSMALDLRETEGVLSAEPILGRKLSKKSTLPNDRFFPDQWFLFNTGQSRGKPGIDLNILGAWDKFRGRGVNIAIVDDGVELTHLDLFPSTRNNLHHDYRDNDNDANPGGNDDFHGTAVGGVAAASGNNGLGITGIAFEASLVSIRLVGGLVQTDDQSAAAMVHSNRVIHVSNNSWGAEDDGKNLDGPGPLMRMARENSARNGREGKGTIFVWSGGNGRELQDNVNYDGYANSIYVFAVGAINDLGKQAAYSEPGACLVVTAPSNVGDTSAQEGIVTTDVTGDDGLNFVPVGDDLSDTSYTRYFGGTSAAAAMVSGVAALVLEANPNLSWRDMKEILMSSATQVDPADSDWITNGAGLHFSHKYGGGLVNASAAVKLATNWVNLGPQASLFRERTNLSVSIPDNDPAGTSLPFDFRSSPALRVEHAVITLTILHPHRGDLAITLISPQGTRSRLAERHADLNPDFNRWEFSSVLNWGETSQGEWKLLIADLRATSVGTLKFARLELFGTEAREQTRPWLTATAAGDGKLQVLMTGLPGFRYEIQASANLVDWLAVLSTNLTSGTTIELNDPGVAGPGGRFFRAVRLPLQP